MAEVVPFPLGGRPDADSIGRLLAEAAEDSEKLTFIRRFKESEKWYQRVTSGQVVRCLREGRVVEGPSLNKEGGWRCLLYKLCGGVHVYVTVALHLKADLSLEHAYVLDVNNRIPT